MWSDQSNKRRCTIVHNGMEYDATILIQKSETARNCSKGLARFQVKDDTPDKMFSYFMQLVNSEPVELWAPWAPFMVQLARIWVCPFALEELEHQIIESHDPSELLQHIILCPDSFPTLVSHLQQDYMSFISEPSFKDLPMSIIGKTLFPENLTASRPPVTRIRRIITDMMNPEGSSDDIEALENERDAITQEVQEIKKAMEQADLNSQKYLKGVQELEADIEAVKKVAADRKKTTTIVQTEIKEQMQQIKTLKAQLETTKQETEKLKKQKNEIENEIGKIRRSRR